MELLQVSNVDHNYTKYEILDVSLCIKGVILSMVERVFF